MLQKVPFSFTVVVGFMLFALFFGAGNLIFPAMLGQSAGTNVWLANAGFLATGVGLPLIGVMAFGFSGKEDLRSLANRVHPIFGAVFTTILYLTIGPLFAIPRTGSVSFEIGVKPFLSENSTFVPLLACTIIFFSLTCFFSLNPAKIVDVVGKFLTPIMLVFIGILVVVACANPIGSLQAPLEKYQATPFFNGFQEGYLTMDTLASFVFGIIVISAIKEKGVQTKKQIMLVCLQAVSIAAVILAMIYTALSYVGAASVAGMGRLDNGGAVLASVSNHYFGVYGGVLLGLIIFAACLTTSVGLIAACSAYFHQLLPGFSYKKIAIALCVFSTVIANIGLTQLISISVPVLTILYPLAIVLIVLTFLHPLFKGHALVYQGSLLATFLVSLIDSLKQTPLNIAFMDAFFARHLMFYHVGLGWIVPAVAGGAAGLLIKWLAEKKEKQPHSKMIQQNKS